MAKIMKYKILCAEVNQGTEENPDIKQVFIDKTMTWSEENEEIAKEEAYNGVLDIEEIEVDELVAEPTADEILNTMLGVK